MIIEHQWLIALALIITISRIMRNWPINDWRKLRIVYYVIILWLSLLSIILMIFYAQFIIPIFTS